jgi:hypothetical protein
MCVKIALLRPDPAHDADPGIISFIYVRYILFRYRRAGRIAAPGPCVSLLAPRCGAGRADRKYKIVAEPHVKCGPLSALFILRLTFYFLKLQRLFYFMPCYILVIIFIMHHLFTAFIATFIICVYVVCPSAFLFFSNSFKSKSKAFFTVQYFIIQEPYHTAPTVAML